VILLAVHDGEAYVPLGNIHASSGTHPLQSRIGPDGFFSPTKCPTPRLSSSFPTQPSSVVNLSISSTSNCQRAGKLEEEGPGASGQALGIRRRRLCVAGVRRLRSRRCYVSIDTMGQGGMDDIKREGISGH
jgi:hypothetical protein